MKRLILVVCAVAVLGSTAFLANLQIQSNRLKARIADVEREQSDAHRTALIEKAVELRFAIAGMKTRGITWTPEYQRLYEAIREDARQAGFTGEPAWAKLESAVADVGGKP